VDFRILLCVTADRVGLDELKKESIHAVMRVHFANGAIGTASLAATSGNADLDSRIAACYPNVPTGLTANLPDDDELFVVALPAKVETDHF
jgi:hypothetical protein